MKKTIAFFASVILLAGCTFYGGLGKQMDARTLPALAASTDSISKVSVEIEKTAAVEGIPMKGAVPKKSQYVVPLPFVGFFGANVVMKPGAPTLVSPLYANLETALKGEIQNSYPKGMNNNYVLKMKVDSSNFTFRYHKKGFMIWVFIVQFGKKKEWCSPSDLSLSVSYELLNNGVVVKKGAVTKVKHDTEKILSTTPIPNARPYNSFDPFDSPSKAMVRDQQQFAFGGSAGTIAHGLDYNLAQYNILIQDVAKQVIDETKTSVN
jgi:hypothetical protein